MGHVWIATINLKAIRDTKEGENNFGENIMTDKIGTNNRVLPTKNDRCILKNVQYCKTCNQEYSPEDKEKICMWCEDWEYSATIIAYGHEEIDQLFPVKIPMKVKRLVKKIRSVI